MSTVAPPVVAPPSSSGSDKYGLGSWGSTQIDVGGLFGYDVPFSVDQSGTPQHTTSNGTPMTTAEDVLRAFETAPPQVAAQIQQQMYLAGYYSSTATPQPGLIGGDDLTAFKTLLKNVAEIQDSARQEATNGQAAPVPTLSDYLASQATFGQQAGALAQVQRQQQASAKPKSVTVSDPAALMDEFKRTYQQMYGKLPDESTARAFIAMEHMREKQAQLGPQALPGTQADLGGVVASHQGSVTAPWSKTSVGSDLIEGRGPAATTGGQGDVSLDYVMNQLGVVAPKGSWSQNAQAAGLGANAPKTPANMQAVTRFMLQQAVSQTGNWQDAIARVAGPSIASAVAGAASDENTGGLNAPVGALTLGQPSYAGAAGSGTGGPAEVVAPNPTADAEQFAMRQNPAGALAHSVAGQFDNFLKIIGG